MSGTPRFLFLALALLLLGCDEGKDERSDAPPRGTGTAAPATQPRAPATEAKVEYGLDIEVRESDPPQFGVRWTATVPTGGWKMTTDSVLVEDSMGQAVARIWVTLEQPGADEMVTDAVETLTGRHNATTQRVDKAELSVRRHVRGVTHDTPALYAVVKVAPGVEGKE